MTDLSALAASSRRLSFAQIAPPCGERIRLEVRSPHQRLGVQLIGFREPQSLLVSAPRASAVVMHEGTRFTARMMSGNDLCSFETRLLQVQTRPYPYWHLEYPDSVEVRRIRAHARVPVVLSVRVEPDDPMLIGADEAQAAICRDISLQGAQLHSRQPLADVGERLFVTARVGVAGIDHLLLLPALVRNRQQIENGAMSVFSHGVEFVELEEDTRLMLAGFVYEQQLRSLGLLEESEA